MAFASDYEKWPPYVIKLAMGAPVVTKEGVKGFDAVLRALGYGALKILLRMLILEIQGQ